MMMKKLFYTLVLYSLFVFLLASCNLGSKGAPLDVDPTSEQIAINAAVASTLSALPTEISEPVEVLTPMMTEVPEITNTPVITSTPLPTEAPTATVEPTLEPTITATPYKGPLVGEPNAEFLDIYFDAVVRGDYVSAWNNLSTRFKINKHDARYPNYVEGYEKMNLCDIIITDVQVLSKNNSYAQIGAHYEYVVNQDSEGCVGYPYDFVAHFNYDYDLNIWLLDGLTTLAQ